MCVRFLSPLPATFKAKLPDAFKDIAVLDDELGYRLVSQLSNIDQQSRLFAGHVVSIAKPPGTFRIICIGGSTTLGVYNSKLDSYPPVLQSLFDYALANCNKKVEIINAGMMGYHSWHTRLRAETELDSLSPDMYLLMDGLNDVVAAAAIEDINEAIKQREIFTKLINTTPRQTSILAQVLHTFERLAFYRLAKQAVSTLILNDIMEKKMEAFGFRGNIESFIRERQAKGIGVTLVNYGWITRDKASSQSEAARIPYDFNIQLYQFGRSYVSRINNEISRKLDAPLVDLQILIDALSDRSPLLYRVFTDEMHYTPYSDFFVARHIFAELQTNKFLAEFLNDCTLPASDQVDAHFAFRFAWGEHFVGYGRPRSTDKPVLARDIETQNIVIGHTDEDGWCELTPHNSDEEGVVTLRLVLENTNGVLACFPRIFSNRGWVTVEAFLEGAWVPLANMVKYQDDGQWSPVGARYGFSADKLNPNDTTVRVRLIGSGAQLFQKDGSIFFKQPR